MTTEKYKSDYAKEKHGELMLTISKAIFITLFPALLGSVALKMIWNADQTAFYLYYVLSFIGGFIGVLLMKKGLKKIDEVHANHHPN